MFNDFVITQFNPAAGSTNLTDLLKPSPEIMYFEDQNDLNQITFVSHNGSSVYTKEIISGSITGGAEDMLGIDSQNLFHFAGNSPGTMIINSFNGTSHVFDARFSNYTYLVCDIENIGSNPVNILPRVGPNEMDSNSSMYYAFDLLTFTPVNVRTLAAGDSATLVFGLGQDPTQPDTVVWDYLNGPHSTFELLFQPAVGTDFDVRIDNIGMVAVPEPTAFLLFALGALFFRKFLKKTRV